MAAACGGYVRIGCHGSDSAGVTAANPYSLIASAERHGLDPQRYLTGVLANIASTPVSQVGRFLPDAWKQ